MTTPIYTPPGCTTLDKVEAGQIRLGIQGPPFDGKTTSALTFPNPVCCSFDRKVTAHSHRDDVILIPFYDGAFCDRYVRRDGLTTPPNRRDALLKWLSTEGTKFSPQQTLIMDNSTGIEEAFHTQYWLSPVVTKSGEVDSFAEWRQKQNFFGDLMECLKAVPPSIVYICHESADRDKKGELNGKVGPLLTGGFKDKLGGNFTDWFAAVTVLKPANPEQRKKLMEWGRIDESTLQEWIDSTPKEHQTIYLWQTQADELRDCGSTTLMNCPRYILANYSSFQKYRRKKRHDKPVPDKQD